MNNIDATAITILSPSTSTGTVNVTFIQGFLTRVSRPDVIVVYIIAFVVWLLFFLSYIPGIYSAWYLSLKQPSFNVWIPRIAWIVAGALSYIGFYILWRGSRPEDVDRYLAITMLYVVGSFIMVSWSVALFQAQNISLATWLAGILFIFQLGLFFIVWYLRPVAAIFMIPLLALYLYLVYSMIHLAALNNQVL